MNGEQYVTFEAEPKQVPCEVCGLGIEADAERWIWHGWTKKRYHPECAPRRSER